jgi:hypothetical protein
MEEAMAYGDRFTMDVKDFGRKVVITLKRGKAVCTENGKRVTISYEDSSVRGPKKKGK